MDWAQDNAGEWTASRDGFTISTDKTRLDREMIYRFLSDESYWSKGMSRSFFERQIAAGFCFGLYAAEGAQVGFARVATDFATTAALSDVYIRPGHRGLGLGYWLVEQILAHPRLQNLRRWTLSTDDAHGLYARFGFVPADARTIMHRGDPEAHKREV